MTLEPEKRLERIKDGQGTFVLLTACGYFRFKNSSTRNKRQENAQVADRGSSKGRFSETVQMEKLILRLLMSVS